MVPDGRWPNDQGILAYFTRPNRSITSAKYRINTVLGQSIIMRIGTCSEVVGFLGQNRKTSTLPPNAVGKDFRPYPYVGRTDSGTGVEASLWGLLGVKVGWVDSSFR